jgi:2-methylisocitrate lyase-like PEP mutase family enzyme
MTGDELASRCELLRSLHVPGTPLVLPNAWDAATARAVVAAGFPVVATTSAGVAASLGYEDHQDAPGTEMLAAAARISSAVEAPVTVDAEAGYGMDPGDLVAALREAGAAGCNLEDTDHSAGELRDREQHAAWLREVRDAATAADYGLVVNARIDVFIAAFHSGSEVSQDELVDGALERATAYAAAGVDSVYPIALWEPDPLRRFIAGAPAPVNVLKVPPAPTIPELAELGAARISWGGLLHRDSLEHFASVLGSLADER